MPSFASIGHFGEVLTRLDSGLRQNDGGGFLSLNLSPYIALSSAGALACKPAVGGLTPTLQAGAPALQGFVRTVKLQIVIYDILLFNVYHLRINHASSQMG